MSWLQPTGESLCSKNESQQSPSHLSPLFSSLSGSSHSPPATNGGCPEDGEAKVDGGSGQVEDLHQRGGESGQPSCQC